MNEFSAGYFGGNWGFGWLSCSPIFILMLRKIAPSAVRAAIMRTADLFFCRVFFHVIRLARIFLLGEPLNDVGCKISNKAFAASYIVGAATFAAPFPQSVSFNVEPIGRILLG